MCLLNTRVLHENGEDLKCFKNNTSKYTVSTQMSIFLSILKKKSYCSGQDETYTFFSSIIFHQINIEKYNYGIIK